MNRKNHMTLSLLAVLVTLFPTPAAFAKDQAGRCEEALNAAQILLESREAREEGIRLQIAAAEVCRHVQDPALQVRGIVAGIWSLGKTHEKRLYLERELPKAEAATGPESPDLLPILDQLVSYALLDGCDIESARTWVERAEGIRTETTDSSKTRRVDLLTTRGDHAYGLGTCCRQHHGERAAEHEFEIAESAYREAYALLLEIGASDQERYDALDKLRITLEETDLSLEEDLAYEHEQLRFKLY